MELGARNRIPLVTILIPVYNGSNFLEMAIRSAIAQTYPRIEIIVINDGSNDNEQTRDIAKRFEPEIRYIELEQNLGVSAALNVGIKEALGEFISWLSHDDLYHTEKISRQIQRYFEEKNPKTILYSNFNYINTFGKTISKNSGENLIKEQFRFWLLTEGNLHGCSLLIPKNAFDICGLFNEKLQTVQDIDMWFRMSSIFSFVCINEELVFFRIHEQQDSLTKKEVHLAERNDFFSQAILQLTAMDVIVGSGTNLIRGYVTLIESLHRRRFFKAADVVGYRVGKLIRVYVSMRRITILFVIFLRKVYKKSRFLFVIFLRKVYKKSRLIMKF